MMRKMMSDRIWKVTVTGYVIQKEYMDEPDTWDVLDPLQWDDFADVPDIEFTELVELEPMKQCKMCAKYAVPCVPQHGHNPDITKWELCKK